MNTTTDLSNFVEKVKCVVQQQFNNGIPQRRRTADILHMSERTLCRRLAEQKTSYREIIAEFAKQQIVAYLHNTQLSIENIAECVGYSSAQSVNKALVRWIGVTATVYRQQQGL
jgi:AraC-like DNA-binding protein